MNNKTEVLREYFGYSEFRTGQESIIDSLLSGRDVLCIMPTGAGKSVCYQVPALMLKGITLVISPLISLMKDQVGSLCQNGIAAAYLNSSLSQTQYEKALQNMRIGKYKIIYVAPERLETPEFIELCCELDISMIAVDEAHCVSQWGQDFRPSYLKIIEFVQKLSIRPVVGAFTATATDNVKKDILKMLKLDSPLMITTGFDRPNLFFSVIRTKEKPRKLLELVREREGKAGIIYCSTRKTVEAVCELLNHSAFSATRYHAGLSEQERRRNQDDFVFDKRPIMVATNAFGMGIDKSNVSFVVHYNMPMNIESYYQEAGRAGRDGEKADCIMLYSPQDVHTNQFLLEKSEPNPDLSEAEQLNVRTHDNEKLKLMTFYCTINDCLRNYMLKYFGEASSMNCGNCSNCLTNFETVDITVEAQKIMSCIAKTGQRFGKKMIIDILRGSKNERLLMFGLDSQSTYGLMKDVSEHRVRDMIDYLAEKEYLQFSGVDYPVCKLNPSCREVLQGKSEVIMKIVKEEKREQTEKKNVKTLYADIDSNMLASLKKLRREIAQAQNVPSFMIFSDASLVDMCRKCPRSQAEFLDVSGVGKIKCERYAEEFLAVINDSLQ